jgi:hypothetical protein
MRHPNEKVKGKVEALASAGFNQKAIADYLQIKPATLRKHYRHELDVALMDKTVLVAERLLAMALDPHNKNPAPLIFWLKCQSRGGWQESGEELQELKDKAIGNINIKVIGSHDEEVKVEEDKDTSSDADTLQ